MNLLKSLFISTYLTLIVVGLMRALVGIYQTGTLLNWSWVAVGLLPAVGFFVWVFTFDVARTGRGSLALWLPSLLALAGLGFGQAATVEQWLWLAVAGPLCALLYIRWYSRYGERDDSRLKVGSILPELTFYSASGTPVSTADWNGPQLLMFYRGNWCPLCMAQIKEVVERYQQLEQRGVRVVAISPQPPSHTAELAKRFNVAMAFWVDADNRVAKQLGIFAEHGLPMGLQALGYDSDTVMPTVVITDAGHRILFADLTDNYRIRPEPDAFLQVLDQAGIR